MHFALRGGASSCWSCRVKEQSTGTVAWTKVTIMSLSHTEYLISRHRHLNNVGVTAEPETVLVSIIINKHHALNRRKSCLPNVFSGIQYSIQRLYCQRYNSASIISYLLITNTTGWPQNILCRSYSRAFWDKKSSNTISIRSLYEHRT